MLPCCPASVLRPIRWYLGLLRQARDPSDRCDLKAVIPHADAVSAKDKACAQAGRDQARRRRSPHGDQCGVLRTESSPRRYSRPRPAGGTSGWKPASSESTRPSDGQRNRLFVPLAPPYPPAKTKGWHTHPPLQPLGPAHLRVIFDRQDDPPLAARHVAWTPATATSLWPTLAASTTVHVLGAPRASKRAAVLRCIEANKLACFIPSHGIVPA